MDDLAGTNVALCPDDAELLQLIFQGKWRRRILEHLVLGPVRLGELKRAIPDCTKKMLIDNLHALESLGWIDRHEDFSAKVKKVEYTLASKCSENIRRVLQKIQ